ncbi:MAG: pyroglutamyl-peptidase I [Zestosphaera sp.]
MKVLLTGFEPFGGDKLNPSEFVVRRLPEALAKEMSGLEVVTAVLPVSFRRAGSVLRELLSSNVPDIYIGLGLWSGISYVTIERVAVNVKDARIPDNDGEQPVDEPIEPEGPPAYFTTLPKKAILRRLRESGIPAIVSNTAGTFLCNFVMYIALHHSAMYGYPRKAGFMHLPLLPEQAAVKRGDWAGVPPSMSLETMIKAVEIALRTTVEMFDKEDEKIPP